MRGSVQQNNIAQKSKTHSFIFLLILLSGFATLSWEVIWQLKLSLALGISSLGTAFTLATMMGGMSLGSFLMGRLLSEKSLLFALRFYGTLELLIGLSGLLLYQEFKLLEQFDTLAYAIAPMSTTFIYLFGAMAILSIPTFSMGATIPIFNIFAKHLDFPLSKLYSINTFGAVISVLLIAFLFIPSLGVTHTIWLIAAINFFIFLTTWVLPLNHFTKTTAHEQQVFPLNISVLQASLLVFVTGFATFTLEVAWFRSLTDIFPNTTDVFAIILACTLMAISLAAKDVAVLKSKQKSLSTQLILAGIFILLLTPLIERLDINFAYSKLSLATSSNTKNFLHQSTVDFLFNKNFNVNVMASCLYALQMMMRCFLLYFILVPPLRLLALAFPWILDHQSCTRHVGRLYAINTFAAIIGSLSAGWILLPTIGFTKTACLSGIIVIIIGLSVTMRGLKRIAWAVISLIALFVAIFFDSGIGKTRVLGFYGTDHNGLPAKVLAYHEDPEATIAAVEYADLSRVLLINSVGAAWESGTHKDKSIHYMAWMGHLPMILHPNPQDALVICFGTGQTANAVRNESPQTLDIVDINPSVFKLAHYFRSNQNVLNDPRVKSMIMDGRAYLRRTKKTYDVITLEPMPPNNANVNALYSKEFYELAKNKLKADGMIAQWLPLHIVGPYYSASIAKTFTTVFPNAILWLDPDSHSGILIGWKKSEPSLREASAPRNDRSRDLSPTDIKANIIFNSAELNSYTQYGDVITDDNQLLAYGKALYGSGLMLDANFKLLQHINHNIRDPELSDSESR